ncbi:MAG: DeoR/GlpR family DNA-binding transcription regulator [Tepidisphaeraceae bacterium]
MLAVDRHEKILTLLRQQRSITLDALAEAVGVSASTVRRDLEQLEPGGQLQRTHGGVIYVGERQSTGRPYAFEHRLSFNLDAKQKIAKAARDLVSPGQTILIDGGTTTFYFARELTGIPMQIVTNSLPIGQLYQNDENVELILTGGLAYPRYGVLLGPMAEQTIKAIHTQTLFMAPAGLHGGRLYNQNQLLVQAEQQMIQQSQQVVLLCDSAKFGQQALSKLCDLSDVDVIVTDAAPSESDRQMIETAGCRLIVAE